MARTAPVPNMAAIPGMNPGIWVMGGGAGGGGGSGDGQNGNGEGEGANGANGGNDPNGGGKGAGACGAGSPGACTNCGHNVAAGDPVDVTTGKVFTLPARDLFLPGTFNLAITRSYSTGSRELDLGLGHGWRHSLGWWLEEGRGEILVGAGDGRIVELPRVSNLGDTGFFGSWTILRGVGLYVVYPGNEFAHIFRPTARDPSVYELGWIRYRGRGHIALHYEDDRLVRVTDTVGRTVRIARNREGRIASLSVPDPRGESLEFARYRYDDRGNLTGATDADGHETRYSYDDDHRLTQLEYPNGLVLYYLYDARGRCIETWGAYPGRKDPALADDLPSTLADHATPVKGIYHSRLEFAEDYTEVVDTASLRRFFAGPHGKVAKAVGARGGVTSRVFDDNGNVVEQTDAAGGTWAWEHDRFGNVVREVDPEGHTTMIARDAMGRPMEVIDAEGGMTAIERDDNGEIVTLTHANGAVQRMRRDDRGSVVEAIDERGGRHVFELDAQANRVAHTFPSSATYRFEHDHFGRMVREIDPAGAERRNQYKPSGRVAATMDRLGRVSQIEYDGLGNPLRETSADGTTVAWEYGGLGWLCKARQADGSEVRFGHSYEGLTRYIENERGERCRFEHTPDGLLAAEHGFHGQTIRYGRDPIGRVAWIDEGSGKRELVLDKVGQLVEEVGDDDQKRSYEYNARGELVRATSGGVELTWTRSPIGQIVKEELVVDGRRYTVESTINPGGERAVMKTSLGHEVRAKHDATGRVSELWSGSQRAITLTRNAVGQAVRMELAGEGVIADEYDAENRLRKRQVLGPSRPASDQPEWIGAGIPGAVGRMYDYTPADEIQKVTSLDGSFVDYQYDVRRRLRKRVTPAGTETFDVDPAGNYREEGMGAPTRAYAAGNQLVSRGDVSYAYDACGRMIEKRRPVKDGEPEVTRYEWDAWGLLAAVELPDRTRVELQYDAFARRVGKRVVRDGKIVSSRHFVWDLLSMVHDVGLGQGGAPEDVRTHLFLDNRETLPLAHRRGTSEGDWVYHLSDVNGTPEELIDGSGRSLGRLDRDAFGRTKAKGGAGTPFRFPGQYEDEETGLHYNRYRYYDPEAGRYISPDPIGVEGGINVYAYAHNPITGTDPMGWAHAMTVTGGNIGQQGGFQGSSGTREGGTVSYTAGRGTPPGSNPASGVRPPCPPEICRPANWHTESKFAHDLISEHRAARQSNPNARPFAGQNYTLTGEYPPCPTCHAAMRRAASETGANITYQWGDQSITYNGDSSPPTAAANTTAGRLNDRYNAAMRDDGTWQNDQSASPGVRNAGGAGGPNQVTQAWGQHIGDDAWTAYREDPTISAMQANTRASESTPERLAQRRENRRLRNERNQT